MSRTYRFHVGDRVRVVQKQRLGCTIHLDECGTVIGLDEADDSLPYHVRADDGDVEWFGEEELKLVTPAVDPEMALEHELTRALDHLKERLNVQFFESDKGELVSVLKQAVVRAAQRCDEGLA